MDPAAARFAAARVARLATVTPDGAPHLVPIVFALVEDVIHTAVDGKPKRHRGLRRLTNIAHDPRVSVLADHYDEDWSALWWVRADGVATVTDEPEPALIARYPQYRTTPPPGPYLRIRVQRWTSWAAQVQVKE
ncbi:PPOX class F420-dependent oxidoreductase [Actinoplanes sp. NBRC 14428]|uniref:PPOX class probable F420-dependent enzyme n=1 Tax=Pseudosporangium ferrugineum TaxID=439699 RepID=A0A2T0RLD6_9ACTN|nr:TIGR03668 family PPOX class F420-dependent oxidoreductase [Pseudosporangium ferrugineum]PRY21947.1 PPOX class probable F420-dependent enzyme [Pseudosporangium ferrugineum]BCJ50787.1 PPOX class F420-dependent oxidoreductase [Actinoplanes sp. NBRC 14428]